MPGFCAWRQNQDSGSVLSCRFIVRMCGNELTPATSHQAWSETMLRFEMLIAGPVGNSPTEPIFS